MSIISVKNASFGYSEKNVFDQINLDIQKGKVCCLMGPNGCGKSTLIDCLLGINNLREGNIFVEGKNVKEYKRSELARCISYVPQVHDKTFPYKVAQIVLMGRSAYMNGWGSPDKEDEKKAYEALEKVGMLESSQKPYTEISGGEMQMVMLARALAQETPIIMLDEPTAHLDFKNEMFFLETICELVKISKVTIIMATHSPNHAFYFENNNIDATVALINDGKLYGTGSPTDLLTEKNLRDVYKIEVKIMSQNIENIGIVKQIVSLNTIKSRRVK